MKIGLENLDIKKLVGKVAYLSSAASVDSSLKHGVFILKELLKSRLVAVWGPQHGFISNKQDNMVESDDYFDDDLQLKVYSLYGKYREPTLEMLSEVDTIVIDLSDVGTRVYTYISTMVLVLKKSVGKRVVILDRPNPVGSMLEGTCLDKNFESFVGIHPIIMRHGLTVGELARLVTSELELPLDLEIIKVSDYDKNRLEDYSARFVNPSPNLATRNSLFTFTGTVLFEGTTLSEGRGTTRSLEIIGDPSINPYKLKCDLNRFLKKYDVGKFLLRPTFFTPMFQKHANKVCGGFQIHVLDFNNFHGWRLGILLMYYFFKNLEIDTFWKKPPYEYVFDKLPIDIINGGDFIRNSIENDRLEQILEKEESDIKIFSERIQKYLIY